MKKYKSYFLLHTNLIPFLLIILLFALNSCSKKNFAYLPAYQFKSIDGKPDYSDLHYWAAHPWKKDPSDSVPQPLRASYVQDSAVDVFFIYPTTLTSGKDTSWNAAIDDAKINAKTDYSTILYQASVFNEQCRVFAPRYRQAHYRAFFTKDSIAAPYFDIAYNDIRNAFLYYLEHFNNGRPFIIASHSQGTKHAARLIKEFIEGKSLSNRFVCAYIIGMPIQENYFTVLKPCKDAASTDCYISWRTFKRNYEGPEFIAKENFKSVVINPLTWTSDSVYVPAYLNKGGILLKFNKLAPHVVSTQVHHNILWSSKPNFFGKIFLTSKNYHIGDINLFYMNIRENVRTRINAFWKYYHQ
jgi:hypothetical protein